MEELYKYYLSAPDIPFGGTIYAKSKEDAFRKMWKRHVIKPTRVDNIEIIFLEAVIDSEVIQSLAHYYESKGQ